MKTTRKMKERKAEDGGGEKNEKKMYANEATLEKSNREKRSEAGGREKVALEYVASG